MTRSMEERERAEREAQDYDVEATKRRIAELTAEYARQIEEWNRSWHIGVRVRVQVPNEDDPRYAHTRSAATHDWTGEPVIWLDEYAAPMPLARVDASPVWLWSDSEHTWTANKEFSEYEDAIADACADLEPGARYWVGYQCRCVKELALQGEDIQAILFDTIGARMFERVGEIADGWPEVSDEQTAELANRLNDTIRSWLRENGLDPMFTCIEGVEERRVP